MKKPGVNVSHHLPLFCKVIVSTGRDAHSNKPVPVQVSNVNVTRPRERAYESA